MMLALQDWQNLYMLTGTASATLIGLLFVAISLGGYLPAKEARDYIRTFVEPTLINYAQVLFLSCFALMPFQIQNALLFRIAVAILGIINIFLAFKVLWRVRVVHQRDNEIDRDHWIWDVLLPGMVGLLFVGGDVGLFFEQHLALLTIASVVLLCLAISLHNTWVLMIWLTVHKGVPAVEHESVSHHEKGDPDQEEAEMPKLANRDG
jgi:small-conductance mechanosensitive channel